MVDTSQCFSLIRGRMMRVTRLDGCGARVLGPDSAVVSDGFIQVAYSPQTDEGTTISVTNAAGKVCILDEPAPKFLNYNVEIQLCGVNPDLMHLFTGQDIIYDAQETPQGVGFAMDSALDADDSGFALEVWSSVPVAACADGNVSYGYTLLPFVKGGLVGDFTIANDAVNFTITGAKTKDGNAWGVGPYDVVADEDGDDSPLLASIPTTRHMHMQLTTVAPPATVCGAVPLGVPATLITAGIPATLTPANAYTPLNLADIQAVLPVKTPTTAWTTGQYVLLRDGSKVHWTSSAWAAGPA